MNKVLGTVVVRAESVPGEGGFKDLQRAERDADIDAVVLVIYWNKPCEADVGHPWMSELRDMMFSAQPVGSDVEVIVDSFLRYEEEARSHGFVNTPACTGIGAFGVARRCPQEWHERCRLGITLACHQASVEGNLGQR